MPEPLPTLSDLLQGLTRGSAYPHSVRGLHVLQTHASCVFLTGDWVYKIKKPVDFGFLDYRSLETRHRCCRQEVDLNRRLCPEVYLDVVPVVRTPEGLRVMAPGEPVEWAVRMRQLPEADMLSQRLREGRVTRAEIERLAEKLARFHTAAPETPHFGSLEVIRENLEENFAQTEPLMGDVLPRECREQVTEFARVFLREHEELFRQRVQEGRIRDGHGDLRAQNICLSPEVGDGIQVLDCIEFNERFRCGDLAADLAYLAMDLDLAGRRDLREILVRKYGETTGDASLAEMLPFYLCYRAYVRGKIALFAAREGEIPEAERRAHAEVARAAFDLSRSYAVLRGPVLVAMAGYSGSGKSVLARELARRIPAVRLSSDEVRKEGSGAASDTPLGTNAYTEGARHAVYSELFRRAGQLLRDGTPVLLDATFLPPRERDRAAELAHETGAILRFVECWAPAAVIRQRLGSRTGDASDAGTTVFEGQWRDAGVERALSETRGRPEWVTVSTDQPSPHAAREALASL